jgi:hypothetical protein
LIPNPIALADQICISGTVSTRSSSVLVDLLLIIDSDLSNIQFIERSLNPGSFNILKVVSSLTLSYGLHSLVFHVVDIPYGCISTGYSLSRMVVPVRSLPVTATPSPTFTMPIHGLTRQNPLRLIRIGPLLFLLEPFS